MLNVRVLPNAREDLMTERLIRNAGFEDAGAIFALVKEHPDELLPRPISDIVQNIDRFIVAEDASEIVGTVSWQILPEIGLASSPYIEIKSLAVKEGVRGQDIGSDLVLQAIERIRGLHPERIVALTFHSDFFAKLGFVEVPKQELMHKIYMGCVNCAKYDSPFTCPEIAMVLDAKGKK